jgi:hypothetical protein
MIDIERLRHDALDADTIDDWKKCVRHAKVILNEDNKKEIMRDTIMEPIIITIIPDDSNYSSVSHSDDDENHG